MPIITSLIDSDFYKFTQMQFVFHRFPDVEVEYTFKCRNKIDLLLIADKIEEEIKALCGLKFTTDEIAFLRQQEVFQEDYLEFLKDFKLDYKNIIMPVGREFELIIKGKWIDTILFETPVLAIISELYSLQKIKDEGRDNGLDAHEADFKMFHNLLLARKENLNFIDFGTRRRLCRFWHGEVVLDSIEHCKDVFKGTSNVFLAKEYKIKPIGTQAHEIYAAAQRIAPNLLQSQKFILEQWLDEYKGKLGIALTDIITMDAFLKDFNYDLATAYQGCRQDSGDPYVWGNKLIAHYKNLDIDPLTKTAVFSDGLTFEEMVKLNGYFKNRINVIFGIGTNLTNNVGIEPANIVIKLTKVNGQPVAKISDSPGKTICEDKNYLKRLRDTFGVI